MEASFLPLGGVMMSLHTYVPMVILVFFSSCVPI